MKIVVAASYKRTQINTVLETIHKNGTVVYKGRNTVKALTVGGEKWNVKVFKIPPLINKIAYRLLRKSKAQRSFEYAQYLLEKGFLTPKPIAYAENRQGLFLLDSFYFSEQLNYDLTFRELITNIQYPDRKNILEQFTEFTYNLQVARIHFIDHSPGNTLIVKDKKGKYKFYLVDLNRMSFGHLDYSKRIQNFARLSLTDEMIEIIAVKYAAIANRDFEEVYADMLNVCHASADKRARKAALKKKVGL
ncbi:MAG: lipopolysaccharide kinase InaA family protein [Flavobacteriaceae bacterium]